MKGNAFRGGMPRRTNPPTDSPTPFSSAVSEATSHELFSDAQRIEREQAVMVNMASPETAYLETLAIYIQAKHEQVESIESRIENLIEQEEAALQQIQTRQPGLFSSPTTRRTWQGQQQKSQARIQSLHNRLDAVREIKEGVGLHTHKTEELAIRKVRLHHPDVAEAWDELRETARRHEALRRKQEQEHKLTQKSDQASTGLTLKTKPS